MGRLCTAVEQLQALLFPIDMWIVGWREQKKVRGAAVLLSHVCMYEHYLGWEQ